MKHGKLSRDDVVSLLGETFVDLLDTVYCEPTSRLQTDGDNSIEYSASKKGTTKDGRTVTVTAYYYLTPWQQQVMDLHGGDGSVVDWVIEGYDVE